MFSLFAGYCIAFPNEDSKRGHVSGFLAKHFEIRAVDILLAHGRAKYVIVLNFNSRLAILEHLLCSFVSLVFYYYLYKIHL